MVAFSNVVSNVLNGIGALSLVGGTVGFVGSSAMNIKDMLNPKESSYKPTLSDRIEEIGLFTVSGFMMFFPIIHATHLRHVKEIECLRSMNEK